MCVRGIHTGAVIWDLHDWFQLTCTKWACEQHDVSNYKELWIMCRCISWKIEN